ncbi:MAG: YdbH domain-containing protein [Amphiplicatus sp.]
MRTTLRLIAALIVIVAGLAAGIYFFRCAVAEAALRSMLVRAGVENPSLDVKEISLERLTIADLKGGENAVDLIDVSYDFFGLLRGEKVKSVALGPGRIAIALNERGAIRVAGVDLPKGDKSTEFSLPVERVKIDGLAVKVTAPEGSGAGLIEGALAEDGGAFKLDGETAALTIGEWRAADASLRADVTLGKDGAFAAEGRLAGDFGTPQGAFKAIRLDLSAEGESWREMAAGRSAETMRLAATLAGAAFDGEARLLAAFDNGAWRYDAALDLGEHKVDGIELGATHLAAKGVFRAPAVDGDVTVQTRVKSASLGALSVSQTNLEAALRIEIDLDAKTLSAFLDEDCIALQRVDFRIAGQDSEGRLSGAGLCAVDDPLLTTSFVDGPRMTFAGRLAAKDARYRLAKTLFEGAPPMIDFRGSYDSAARTTTAQGSLSKGRILINKAIIAADAAGLFDARLDAAGMTIQSSLSRLRLSQNASPVQIAPVMASGAAKLAEDKFVFDFAAATPAGFALGDGAGAHDVKSGRGALTVKTGRLDFTPRGLQPANVVPALKGQIGTTDGAAEGVFTFAWGPRPADNRSAGDITFDDVSFYGPGRAVTKTEGLSGRLKLTSLAPLKSDGPQTLSLRHIDMDALQLEDGTAEFELPGDETLHIIRAEFPWFGGRIGAYDAVASLSGERAATALRARHVDLGQMLGYLNIDGLSGEGVVEGVLPIFLSEDKARVDGGLFYSAGKGVIRYAGQTGAAASSANKEASLAFDILRELHFDKLAAEVNGPLDGTLKFNVLFEGLSGVPVNEQRVVSPVVYRISIEAPLLALIEQARLSTDFRLQFERLKERSKQGE